MGQSVSYSRPMSRWDVAPTASQRWISLHRSSVRLGVLLFVAVCLIFGAYVLATEGFSVSIWGAVGGLAGSLSAWAATGSTARYVENWDREHASAGRE